MLTMIGMSIESKVSIASRMTHIIEAIGRENSAKQDILLPPVGKAMCLVQVGIECLANESETQEYRRTATKVQRLSDVVPRGVGGRG